MAASSSSSPRRRPLNAAALVAFAVATLALSTFAAPAAAAGLLLARPERDCLTPAAARVNEFSLFPEDARSTIAERPKPAPGAVVREREWFGTQSLSFFRAQNAPKSKQTHEANMSKQRQH